MLQPLCFLVHFVPGVLKHIMKKQFKEPVVPDEFPRPALSRRG